MEILVEGCAERQVRPELGELQLGLEHEGDGEHTHASDGPADKHCAWTSH